MAKRYKTIDSKKGPRVSTRKELFLKAFAKCGIVTTAAKRAKVGPMQHYRWLESDPQYPQRFEEARQQAIEHLEELLLSQAESGNTTALIFALKSNCPEKYRENYQRVELSGPGGGPIAAVAAVVDPSQRPLAELTDEELERLIVEEVKALRALDEQPALGSPELNGHGALRIEGPEAAEVTSSAASLRSS